MGIFYRAMLKRVFGYMRTANAQITLRIRAVWSGSSLFAYRIINKEQRPGWYFAHEQDDLNMRILRIFKKSFSLDAAQLIADGIQGPVVQS